MNRLNFWIQANKTKWYFILTIVALLLYVSSKSDFLHGCAFGLLLFGIPYFIGLGFQQLKNKKQNKEQTAQVSGHNKSII